MKKFYTLILSILTISVNLNAQITELFFSEYSEGSSNNKYIEIYNGTSATISLDNYAYPSVSNQPTTPGEYEFWNDFDAGASIAPGDVYIVAHGSSDPAILAEADETHDYLSNGDDGYALVYGSNPGAPMSPALGGYVIIDFIGDWNGDPGSGWEVAGVTDGTVDHTLVRKSSVTSGNTNWTTSAGTDATDSEWIVHPNETWTYLGSHTVSASCPDPTALGASNLTSTSADLGWTVGGSETVWELVWGAQGTTPATGTLVNALQTNPYTLTGLTANTAYDFYVKADCGHGTASTNLSAWAGPFTFTTSCAPPSAPVAGAITQPTCTEATGSFTITSYESTSTYTFSPSGPTVDGSGVVTLAAGVTYTFTETNALGCISALAADSQPVGLVSVKVYVAPAARVTTPLPFTVGPLGVNVYVLVDS